jgi:hypothetical protein
LHSRYKADEVMWEEGPFGSDRIKPGPYYMPHSLHVEGGCWQFQGQGCFEVVNGFDLRGLGSRCSLQSE